MGGAHTAMSEDFTAVYYNPAGLTAASEPGFGIGFMLSRPQLSLEFDKSERAIAELEPPGSDGVTFGAVFPLGGAAVRNRVVMGLGLNVPTSSLLNGQALDPAIPHWYMYQALPRRIVASLGLGVLPLDWVSLGLGVQFLAGVEGQLDYELDVVAGRLVRKTVTFDIVPNAAPILGLELRPLQGLRIGISYRASIESDVDLPVEFVATGIAELEILTAFQVQYTPHQLSVGASYAWAELDLKLAADLTWAMWSLAPDPSVASSIDVGGELFAGTGFDQILDAPAPGQERNVDLAFRDIWVLRLGAERALGMFSVRAGYAIRPSPAPLQTSGTNYVDVTTHQVSLGGGVRFLDPLQILANPLTVDVAAALLYAPNRRYEKVDAQDPVGGYDASGVIWVLGLALRYEFGEGESGPPAALPPAPPLLKLEPAPPPASDEVSDDGAEETEEMVPPTGDADAAEDVP